MISVRESQTVHIFLIFSVIININIFWQLLELMKMLVLVLQYSFYGFLIRIFRKYNFYWIFLSFDKIFSIDMSEIAG